MNKQKLFSVLSIMGLLFVIAIGVGYVKAINNRGEVILLKQDVSDPLAREFNRVISKNRLEPMTPVEFVNPAGETVSWDDFENEYLLVNFWATWCSPCVVELPSLDRLEKKFAGQGLRVIGVSIDLGRSHEEIKQFLYNRNLGEFAAHWDANQDVQKNIRMRGIPTTYLLDKSGHILHIFEGDANWTSAASLAFFRELLSDNPPSE